MMALFRGALEERTRQASSAARLSRLEVAVIIDAAIWVLWVLPGGSAVAFS